MFSITQIQSYLRESARQRYDAVGLPPFTLFFHPTDSFPSFNYAIPDEAPNDDVQRTLVELQAVFTTRRRQPRFEFIEEFAPRLATALRQAGFVEEGRYPL